MNKIKKLRKKHNLSQRKLAELLQVGYRTVQRWESNKREPSLLVIKALEKLDQELSNKKLY